MARPASAAGSKHSGSRKSPAAGIGAVANAKSFAKNASKNIREDKSEYSEYSGSSDASSSYTGRGLHSSTFQLNLSRF